ncbi:MAG: DUF3999 domain-containing protein [Rhodopirellula sp.]|nr:DUF3999 domain-containing protein [Rhodopirellula sp.]
MNRIWIAAAGLMLVSTSCFGEDDAALRPFPLLKPIERAASGQEEILAVALDAEVYAAEEELTRLRVFDSENREIPCRLDKATENRRRDFREPCPSTVQSLVEHDDNRIEVVVRRDDKAPTADGIIFHTPLADFERRVSVFGSDDGDNWQPLVENAMIFDYSRYMDISNREVPLPKNSYRRLKAVVAEVTDLKESSLMELSRQFRGDEESGRTEQTTVLRRPLRIDRLELWHTVTRELVKQQKTVAWPIAHFATEIDSDQKQTIVHVRTRREPLTQLTLETGSVNFSRPARVQTPVERGMTTEWVDVGRATVSVFRFRSFQRVELKIPFSEQRSEEYRIVIDNGDSPPLKIKGVKAEGSEYRMLFFASPDCSYRLAYGSESAETPRYDTAALSAALGQGYRPVAVTLGPEAKNEVFGGHGVPDFAKLLNNPLFLGVAIGLMVIVLGLLLFRASPRIDHLGQEEE